MNAVDVHDQKSAASRASKKYWKYILTVVVDCCCVSVWILSRLTLTRQVGKRKNYPQKYFILELGKELIDAFSSRK